MRLKPLQRILWLIFGFAALGGGATAAIMDVAAAGVLGLILPSFLVIIVGIMGVVPNMNLKEGSFDLKNIEEPKPTQPVEDPLRPEIDKLRTELERVGRRVEDYILAHDPAPDDDLTDEERLPAFYRAYRDLDQETEDRYSTGEDYDDGLSAEDLRKARDEAHDAMVKEERRQWAQFEFGMRRTQPKSIYET